MFTQVEWKTERGGCAGKYAFVSITDVCPLRQVRNPGSGVVRWGWVAALPMLKALGGPHPQLMGVSHCISRYTEFFAKA